MNLLFTRKRPGRNMLPFLKDHPFGVEAIFDYSLVITYALPKEDLARFLPPCLEPDIFGDKWGFVAVALVQTKGLRPRGFPVRWGNDFFLIGYRIFTRYTTIAGKQLRGLYILRSETDKKRMEVLGSLFTHYRYGTTDIAVVRKGARLEICSVGSGLEVVVEIADGGLEMPQDSVFTHWKQARRYAGPLPFTFTYSEQRRKVTMIEGVRGNWVPEPVRVVRSEVGFLRELQLGHAVVASAFIVEQVPYRWKKGKSEIWSGQGFRG